MCLSLPDGAQPLLQYLYTQYPWKQENNVAKLKRALAQRMDSQAYFIHVYRTNKLSGQLILQNNIMA